MRLRSTSEGTGARGGLYFANPSPTLSFIPSGSALLDCVLGGGWVLGRMSNIIGDRSSAKTGLTIEAMASFAAKYPKGLIYHREVESAFDVGYAERMGYPTTRIVPWEKDHSEPLETVEDIFEDLDKLLGKLKQPSLYVVDSWDALSDRAAQKRAIDKGSYDMTKQKQTNRLFKELCRRIQRARMCLLIVSQTRQNIGVMFGEKLRRAGGASLDFYSSHCLWLANAGFDKVKIDGSEEVQAIKVKARCKKNKVGAPYKQCLFTYRLGYGIDEVATCAAWLAEIGRLEAAVGYKKPGDFLADVEELSNDEYRQVMMTIGAQARVAWADRQSRLFVRGGKYA